MLTDTGHQVSLQLGTGLDAFPVTRGVLETCLFCKDAVMVQHTVGDHEATHARRHICPCAVTSKGLETCLCAMEMIARRWHLLAKLR